MVKALFHSFSKKATKAEIIRQFRLLEIENAKLRTENEDRRKTQSEQADMLFKQGKDIEILKGDYKELQTQEHAIRQERNILSRAECRILASFPADFIVTASPGTSS